MVFCSPVACHHTVVDWEYFYHPMIQDLISGASWSLNPWFNANFPSIWHALKMKLGFSPVAVALALSITVQADCPDYTTYSQVSIGPKRG
jgi:hypothetical protein